MDVVALVKQNKKVAIALGSIAILILLGGFFSINPFTKLKKKEPETKSEPAAFKVVTPETDGDDAADFSRPTTEDMKQQAEYDRVFAKAIEELSEEYTWFTRVPIREEEFIIVYDYEKKKFRLALQIPDTSTPEKIDAVINRALDALIEIDVDPEKEGFYTTFKD